MPLGYCIEHGIGGVHLRRRFGSEGKMAFLEDNPDTSRKDVYKQWQLERLSSKELQCRFFGLNRLL